MGPLIFVAWVGIASDSLGIVANGKENSGFVSDPNKICDIAADGMESCDER